MEIDRNFQVVYQQLEKSKKKNYREATLFLQLKGKMLVTLEDTSYSLRPGDLFMGNLNERIKLDPLSQESCLYVELTINSLFFAEQFPDFFYSYFECTPRQKEQGKIAALSLLQKEIAELCLIDFSDDETKTLKTTLSLCQIILLLVQSFQKHEEMKQYLSENSKMPAILEHIEDNYRSGMTLKEVADLFFMSEPSLSKIFKRETGEYFSGYLRKIRIKASTTELLYTTKSVEQIALDSGFNNSKTYRQHFKQILGESPTAYRSEHVKEFAQPLKKTSDIFEKKIQSKEILLALYQYTQGAFKESTSVHLTSRNKQLLITANDQMVQKEEAEIIIHISSLEKLASVSVQEEILLLKETVSIAYISVETLFENIPLSISLHKKTSMNSFPAFGTLDSMISFLIKENLALFFQFPLGETNEFTKAYKRFFDEFLRHIYNQFGAESLKKWRLNCLFQSRNQEENALEFSIINQRFASLISVGAEIPISDPYYITENKRNLAFFFSEIVPNCAFLSFTAEPNYIFYENGTELKEVKKNYQYVLNKLNFIQSVLKENGVKLPLYLTKWNTLTGTTRDINGIFFRGAIVTEDLLRLDEQVSGYGFWLNIELYEENALINSVRNDGLELFHYFSGKRPAFYCLYLIQRVKGTILSQGTNFLFTDNQGKYQLLLWNSNYFDPHLSSEEAFLESQILSLGLTVLNIKAGNYQVKEMVFDRHHGALFYSYNEFNQAETLDNETQAYISQMTHPKINVFDRMIEEAFNYYVTLDTNAVILLELTPII